jgi:hypothetical protein
MTQTQILFRVKLQGFFTRDGFTLSNDIKPMTITKFTDGTFMIKAGHKTLKHRFSTNETLGKMLGNFLANVGLHV